MLRVYFPSLLLVVLVVKTVGVPWYCMGSKNFLWLHGSKILVISTFPKFYLYYLLVYYLLAQLHPLQLEPKYQHRRPLQGTMLLMLSLRCQWQKMHAKNHLLARLFLQCFCLPNSTRQKHHSPAKLREISRSKQFEGNDHKITLM